MKLSEGDEVELSLLCVNTSQGLPQTHHHLFLQGNDLADGSTDLSHQHHGNVRNMARYSVCKVTQKLNLCLESNTSTHPSRSTVLIPWTHVAAWYYIVDTYAMYMAFSMRKNIVHRRTKAKLILFLLEKWSYILHHLFIAVGYVVIVVRLKPKHNYPGVIS